MDNYILIICHETILDVKKNLVEEYLKSLFPSIEQYRCSQILANDVASLMKPHALHGRVLSKFLNLQDVEWFGPLERLDLDNLLPTEIFSPDSGNEVTSKDFTEQLCEAIHSLADQLPTFGTYKLNILLSFDVLKDLSVSEEPALAGAFYRLMKWHSAEFSLFIESHSDTSRLNEWCEITNADIFDENSVLDLGPRLWRGCILLSDFKASESIAFEGLELRLDLPKNEENFSIYQHPAENILKENPEHILLSSKMCVVDQCSFASIPPYLISPLTFRLLLGKPNMFNDKSIEFLNYLLNKDEAALILRLGYAKLKEKNKGEKKYCTSRWRKAVSSGCIKDADTFVSSFEDFITFVATKSETSSHINVFPIRHPDSLDPSFYLHFVNYKVSSLSNFVPSDSKNYDLCMNILKEVPFIDASLFYKIVERLKKLNFDLYKNNDSNSKAKISSEISYLWEEVKLASKPFLADTSSDVTFEEIDPSDWRERIHLLSKQMQNEDKKKSYISNNLLNLGPKLPIQSVSFSSEDVKKYFLPSGEPKNSVPSESIQPLSSMNHRSSHTFEAVQSLKWPDICKCSYHDLYYNSSAQSEEKEAVGNQMVNHYVKHETASTCNKQQITQNFAIIIQGKSSTKEFKSPSVRKPSAINKDNEDNSDYKENSFKDLITKKILSAMRPSSSQNTAKRKEVLKKENVNNDTLKKDIKRKIEIPVRCSPRKKKPVVYKYPTNRNVEPSKSSQASKPNGIPDLLRKKLRHAVATALENNGINLDDTFFQPCGKKLFTICQAFVQDIPQKKGKTSEHLQKIADAHVKQVIEFERQKHQR